MQAAISLGAITLLAGPFFLLFIYLLWALVLTGWHRLVKGESGWYAATLERSYAKTHYYPTFGAMLKDGMKMALRMTVVMTIIVVMVTLWLEMKGSI